MAVFQTFDAFGVNMTKPLLSTRSFAWRGQEGSVTDRDAGLVYMQARHYDPSTGRFIQADFRKRAPDGCVRRSRESLRIHCEAYRPLKMVEIA